jgi:glutamine synthetase
VLPEGLAQRYFAEQLRRCEALKSAADPAEYERTHYFCAI